MITENSEGAFNQKKFDASSHTKKVDPTISCMFETSGVTRSPIKRSLELSHKKPSLSLTIKNKNNKEYMQALVQDASMLDIS
jgi:hypothetical protein